MLIKKKPAISLNIFLAVEAVQQFGTNVVSFQMAMGERRWYTVRCYLALDDTFIIESVIDTLKECSWGAKLLVAGDFNTKLSEPEGIGHCGGTGDGGPERYVGALPPALERMVPVQEDVENDTGGEGVKVPNGLHSGDGLPSILAFIGPGPQE